LILQSESIAHDRATPSVAGWPAIAVGVRRRENPNAQS